MGDATAEAPDSRLDGRLVCLGEALVDLICPDRIGDRIAATHFEVHFGGALANVAVAAARAGAPTALAGGCGNDEWGELLRAKLRAEGVDIEHYAAIDGIDTPFAFAFFDLEGEVHFEIHGDGIDAGIGSLRGREPTLVANASGLAFGSNTLVGESSLAITRAAAEHASERGAITMFDPNLRPGRWEDAELARTRSIEFARLVDVLKCNVAEARWLLGEDELTVAAAAEGLLDLGPAQVVVTAGSEAAVARGVCDAEILPPAVEIVSQLGAGDAFMGTLAASIVAGGLWEPAVESGLRRAVEAGAETCTHLGASRR